MTPLQRYQQDMASAHFVEDAAQAMAIEHLQQLYDALTLSSDTPVGFGHRLKSLWQKPKPELVKGLYFWGGVGRGKTYLMDLFFDSLPFEQKQRLHFHRFMRMVHQRLKALSGHADPLQIIAQDFARQTRVLCFDEFFVSDITDAMILAGLLGELFKGGVTLVATSNIEPDRLYENGLQRSRFLPAIALVNECTQVVNLDGGIDYRLRALEQAEIYHSPLDAAAQISLQSSFDSLASESVALATTIEVEGRQLQVVASSDDVVWFEFSQLCQTARSQYDYVEIAHCYHAVVMANVPQMSANNDDAARRFISLVDEFYDRNVKLILSAAVPLAQLYIGGGLSFEFQRTLSRLLEMQSHEFLAREHLA